MQIKEYITTMLSDMYTPVSVFLQLRNHYAQVILLESSEYASKEGSYSFLACLPLTTLEIKNDTVTIRKYPLHEEKTAMIESAVQTVNAFIDGIKFETTANGFNGVFGFTAYDAIKYFENGLYRSNKEGHDIPDILYSLYRFIFVFDHFNQTLSIIENCPFGENSQLQSMKDLIQKYDRIEYAFSLNGEAVKSVEDHQFEAMVSVCKSHCQRGDVFQIVPSQSHALPFFGDEFSVYRKLRSINPSPYLFYFDYGNFKLFGSSPEAQLIVKDGYAEVHPIAGTIKRSNDMTKDLANTAKLIADEKENAEHVMLVDLARNDLSRNNHDVKVASYKEIQYFSHVIHLVSKVKGQLNDGVNAYQVFGDTFPQGTLSGAPKIKAIEIIENLEPRHRGHYGGAIGIIGFDNSLNHAIIIRSVLSQSNTLFLQAGAGIVIDSVEENELKEVNNKLGALKKALEF